MGMTAQHFLRDGAGDVAEIEQPLLFRHLRVEHDLKQQVAQFLLQRRPVLFFDRARDLIGFLDRIWRDGAEGLLAVPRAARLRIPQPPHDGEQLRNRAICVFGHAAIEEAARRPGKRHNSEFNSD